MRTRIIIEQAKGKPDKVREVEDLLPFTDGDVLRVDGDLHEVDVAFYDVNEELYYLIVRR